jgi:hypothetical protein
LDHETEDEMSKTSTADALMEIGLSDTLCNRGLEPANLVDALKDIGDGIRYAGKWLGNGEAATPMGALEAHGKAILDASENIASAIRGLAEAIQEAKR